MARRAVREGWRFGVIGDIIVGVLGSIFEFGADAQAVAITLAAQAKASSTGASAGASATKHDAATAGEYHKGMATFTIIKGGLMYEASIAGQKFGYTRR